jgi:hypothetical protein
VLTTAGAEVDAAAHNGRTPLHAAAACRNGVLDAALLAAGADPTLTDHGGDTAAECVGEDDELPDAWPGDEEWEDDITTRLLAAEATWHAAAAPAHVAPST